MNWAKTKRLREAAVRDFMRTRTLFDPTEFVEWVAENLPREHPCWLHIHGPDDDDLIAEAKRKRAVECVRDLRVTVSFPQPVAHDIGAVVVERVFPLLISTGGGKRQLADRMADPRQVLRREGIAIMNGWLTRYAAAFEADEIAQIRALCAAQKEADEKAKVQEGEACA